MSEVGIVVCDFQHFVSLGDADGDSDAVVAALAQVMLSPHCRTVEGEARKMLEEIERIDSQTPPKKACKI